jgi:hypothetical protein
MFANGRACDCSSLQKQAAGCNDVNAVKICCVLSSLIHLLFLSFRLLLLLRFLKQIIVICVDVSSPPSSSESSSAHLLWILEHIARERVRETAIYTERLRKNEIETMHVTVREKTCIYIYIYMSIL